MPLNDGYNDSFSNNDFIEIRKNILEPILKINNRRRENIVVFFTKMSKLKQKIVLFIEPAEAWEKPSKIGNLFMNRFAIDEDAKNEILKIYQLEYSINPLKTGRLTVEEGLDLINY